MEIDKKERQLLREFRLFECDNITEADSTDGILTMSGILQKAGAVNANNRVYPRPILEREDQKFQELIQGRAAIGELDHPDSPIVQLENGSHIVTKTWWDADDLLGEIEILDTPKGKILESYVRRGVRLGISSRGLGSTSHTSEGHDLVEEDFSLVTYDMVSNPSTSGAFMKLHESREFQEFTSVNRKLHLDRILDEILDLRV